MFICWMLLDNVSAQNGAIPPHQELLNARVHSAEAEKPDVGWSDEYSSDVTEQIVWNSEQIYWIRHMSNEYIALSGAFICIYVYKLFHLWCKPFWKGHQPVLPHLSAEVFVVSWRKFPKDVRS